MKKQIIKPKTAEQKFVEAMKMGMAEYYSKAISENIKRAIAQKKLLAKKS